MTDAATRQALQDVVLLRNHQRRVQAAAQTLAETPLAHEAIESMRAALGDDNADAAHAAYERLQGAGGLEQAPRLQVVRGPIANSGSGGVA